jgi:Tol biopolymer transport system component
MMTRRQFLCRMPAAVLLAQLPLASAETRKKGVLLMNRIGPSSADLYIANADGTSERKLLQNPLFEYNACFSADGKSVLFTSERNGDGQSDIFRCRPDGAEVQPLVTGPSVDDASTLSPDGTRLAFVSTRNGYRANIWLLELRSGNMRNLTGAPNVQGDPSGPNGFFRPSWSPDSQWLAFSSDRNTDWRGHDGGKGWEHTQELSVYVIRADGSGFRRIAAKPGYCLGSPKWSPDGKRVVFYEMTTEDTWGARRPSLVGSAGVADCIGGPHDGGADGAHIGPRAKGRSAVPQCNGNCLPPQRRSG